MAGHDERARRGREVLWEGSVGRFGIDDVELPDGSSARLALLEHPGAAAVVPFVSPRRLVLLRQYRYAAGGTLWEVPAGKLDAGEAPAACAQRELAEETGYRAGRIEALGHILTTPGFTDERIYLFAAFDLQPGATALEQHEFIRVEEVDLADALAMAACGEISDAKTIAALYRAAHRVGGL